MPTPQLPNPTVFPTNDKGWLPVWYNYLKWVGERDTSTGADADDTEYKLVGPLSIVVSGLLQNGLASVALKNDQDAPSTTSYYGTDDDGTKGWHLVGDALDVTADLEKSVDGTTNVVTFGLADLANAGGGSFRVVDFDAKGRASGYSNGDAGDVPYNNASSGLTATDVQAAIDEVAASGGSSGYLSPRLNLVDPLYDFLGKPPTSTTAEAGASYPWVAITIDSPGGSIAEVNGGASAPGVWRLTIGSGTGHTIFALGTLANFTIGAGVVRLPFRFRVPTLSDGTNRILVQCGMRDTWVAAVQQGLYVSYSDNLNGGMLQLNAAVGGVVTTANGTTAVAANTWVSGYILTNAAGTQAELYVNGSATPEATLATGLPTGAMRIGGALYRSLGTTARSLDLDYLGPPQVTFTTPR